MKLYVYRAYGELKGLQLRTEPMPEEDLEGSEGEDGGFTWMLVGTMEASSLEGEIVKDLERYGRYSATASFETFWNA